MIKLHVAQEQSSLPPRIASIINNIPCDVLVKTAIVEACGERKFEKIFKYDKELLEYLEANYRPEGYKIKVITSEGFRDGGYPSKIKLSWYPKQVQK